MSNTIDTRDLYKRQQGLQDLKDAVGSAEEALQELTDNAPDEDDLEEVEKYGSEKLRLEEELSDAQDAFGPDEQTELEELNDLESEISEWRHGETMIPESDFEDYARQFAEDIGAIPDDTKWPCTCIDWVRAARELAMDYNSVTWQGTEYLVRA